MSVAASRPSLDEARRFIAAVDAFCAHFSHVGAKLAADHGILGCNSTIKLHMLFHLARSFEWCDLRHSWCYSWESWIARIARIARASKAGIQLYKVGGNLTLKYMEMLQLRLVRAGEL